MVRLRHGSRGLEVGRRPLAGLARPNQLPRDRVIDAHLWGRGWRSLVEVGGVEDRVVEHPLGVMQCCRAVAPVEGKNLKKSGGWRVDLYT